MKITKKEIAARAEKIEESARGLIKAWEILPGNQRYSEQAIEKWINGELGPAINVLRESLALLEWR